MRSCEQTRQLVAILAGRWLIPILTSLTESGSRYQDLYEALDGISYKMLTETLRRAERDGLVSRHLDPSRIETATLYELTALGLSLAAPLSACGEWVERNWQTVEAARQSWDRIRNDN